MKITNKNHVYTSVLSLTLVLITGCGGGGGGSSTGTAVTSDSTPPILAAAPSITPTNGTTGAGYTATVSFTASEALSAASVKMTCDGLDVTGTTAVAGAVVTFTPTAPGYASSANCSATVNAALTKDLAGNAFVSNVAVTNFTVKALACTGTSVNSPPSFNGTTLIAACGNVFVDPAVAKNRYPAIVDGIGTAISLNKAVYGALQSSQPDVIVCNTPACGTFFAGASLRNVTLPPNSYAGQYVVPRMSVVLTSANWNRNPYVLAHEFSHVEVAVRLNGKRLPAWFDEGLATYVGGEPECTNVSGKGVADLTTLDQGSVWTSYTSSSPAFEKTYCQARAEVSAWITKRGNTAIGQLLQAVGQGQTFTSQYGPMQTQ